jgi:replicative DNA helicase
MQIADYIAQQGKDVIIFALEMSRFELVTRSISRESYRIAKAMQTPQPNNALTFYEISDGQPMTAAKTNILKQAEDYYFKAIAPHIFIVEGEGDVTAEQIRTQVQTHAELTGAAPVVIIDYLQLLQPPDIKGANRWSDKQIVDHNTVALKHISRDFSTPVIGVLSLNRASYNEDVSLSSGKESGAIEYGCDILLGMNQEKENENGTRSIFIDVLKHRGGIKDRRVLFEYTPAYSSFKDKGEPQRISKKKDGSEAAPKKGEKNADGRTVL